MVPIILVAVVGRAVPKTFPILVKLGFKSFLSILNCFGKKKIKTKLDTNSDKTFIKIKEVVTNIIPLYIIFGNIIIMNKSLTICSDILLIT